jgi:hypothetical protein
MDQSEAYTWVVLLQPPMRELSGDVNIFGANHRAEPVMLKLCEHETGCVCSHDTKKLILLPLRFIENAL